MTADVGEYVNVIWQLAPAASVALLQVPPLLKRGGAAGYDMLVAAAVPAFDTVIVCAGLVVPEFTEPKASDDGVAVTLGALTETPVPSKLTVALVLPEVSIKVPVLAPATPGLYVIVSVHDAPTAREVAVVQVPDARYSALLTALREMLPAVAPPVLVIVADWVALVAPTLTLPNDNEVGFAVSTGVAAGQFVFASRYQMYSAMSSRSLVVRPRPLCSPLMSGTLLSACWMLAD